MNKWRRLGIERKRGEFFLFVIFRHLIHASGVAVFSRSTVYRTHIARAASLADSCLSAARKKKTTQNRATERPRRRRRRRLVYFGPKRAVSCRSKPRNKIRKRKHTLFEKADLLQPTKTSTNWHFYPIRCLFPISWVWIIASHWTMRSEVVTILSPVPPSASSSHMSLLVRGFSLLLRL